MLKRIDTAVFDYVKAFARRGGQARLRRLRPEGDGVGYAKSGGYVDDISDQIDEAADKIKSGEIKVPTDPAKVQVS